jgi:hypothetical protein
MLQNAVGEVSEFEYVKQIGDQDIAQGNLPFVYETYMELLLLACSTSDKKTLLPGKQKRAVYASESDSDNYHGNYETYRVDTNVAEIMANATDSNQSGHRPAYGNKKTFVLWYQWIKLSQEQRRISSSRNVGKERVNSNNGKPRTS